MVLSSFVVRECEESKRFKTYIIWTLTEKKAAEVIRNTCKLMMLGDLLVENSIYTVKIDDREDLLWGKPIFWEWTDNKTLDELFLNEKPVLTNIKEL